MRSTHLFLALLLFPTASIASHSWQIQKSPSFFNRAITNDAEKKHFAPQANLRQQHFNGALKNTVFSCEGDVLDVNHIRYPIQFDLSSSSGFRYRHNFDPEGDYELRCDDDLNETFKCGYWDIHKDQWVISGGISKVGGSMDFRDFTIRLRNSPSHVNPEIACVSQPPSEVQDRIYTCEAKNATDNQKLGSFSFNERGAVAGVPFFSGAIFGCSPEFFGGFSCAIGKKSRWDIARQQARFSEGVDAYSYSTIWEDGKNYEINCQTREKLRPWAYSPEIAGKWRESFPLSPLVTDFNNSGEAYHVGSSLFALPDAAYNNMEGASYDLRRKVWSAFDWPFRDNSDYPYQRYVAPGTSKLFLAHASFDRAGDYLGKLSYFDTTSKIWTHIEGAVVPPGAATTAAGDIFFIWGGGLPTDAAVNESLLNTGRIFDGASGFWRELPTEGAPSPRIVPFAIVCGRKIFVWGGRDENGTLLANGAMFNLDTFKWEKVSSVGGPLASIENPWGWGEFGYQKGVWTGNEVIVWGGKTLEEGFTNKGWIYSPATDTWRAMSTLFAPHTRLNPLASWTPQGFLVWGKPIFLGEPIGAIYDIQSDRWRNISEDNSPAVRRNSIAVPAGEQGILVFGGAEWPDKLHDYGGYLDLLPSDQ